MTPIEKQENFHKELKELLGKYKAEITIEDFGSNYRRDEKIVITFAYDEALHKENNTGIVPDLVLGNFVW